MKKEGIWKRYENYMIALAVILINIVMLSVRFDFYYDLNDDVFMRNIMSGAYTGIPDGHNVQTLYILGAFISLFYKLYRALPWYGIFLFLCQMGSLCLIGGRLLGFCRRLSVKVGCMVLLTLFLWGILLPHMAALHYTFISAMLAASAIFLFITTPKGLTMRQFVVGNIPSVLLVILAYQLRTEMLLLLFPLIGLAGLFRWSEEEKFFQKENYIKYGIVLFGIVFGMFVSRAIDFAAYGSEAWKEYLVFFDQRTEVYDYHLDVVTSGEHREYLRSIGLNDAQQELLSNYNFGLDERIDARLMGEIAEYAGEDVDYLKTIPDSLRYYIYRMLHAEDAPYNWVVIYLYLCIVLTGTGAALADRTRRGRWSFWWKVILLGMGRTALWMFILIRGRYPERITHSLYFAEAVLLVGMLCGQLVEWKRMKACVSAAGVQMGEHMSRDGMRMEEHVSAEGNRGRFAVEKWAVWLVCALFGLLCVRYFPQSLERTMTEMQSREISHQNSLEIEQYCRAHSDSFYFTDVYSTVGSSQKIFQDVDNTLANHDIMGGWLCKSPLYEEKLGKFGIATMEEGLLDNYAVYFITAKDEEVNWLKAYYAEKGIAVRVEQTELIADDYAVYQLKQ